MQEARQSPASPRASSTVISAASLLLVLLAGGYLRFAGLGVRSLWRDELATWHVSRIGFWDSLSWGPELTKPPLYQFALRLLTQDPHPSEVVLRFPAAVCGVLTILAGWWLGRMAAGRVVGLALAGLLAFNGLQIYYSQEARPYSMLMLWCTLSTIFWYYLVTRPSRKIFAGYVIAAVLALHSHYLAALTIAAHAVWWVIVEFQTSRRTPLNPPLVRGEGREDRERTGERPGRSQRGGRREDGQGGAGVSGARPVGGRSFRPLWALVLVVVLCIPIVVRYLYFRTAMFQGLEWIDPLTWSDTWEVLAELTFGWQWIVALLLPAAVIWIAGVLGIPLKWRTFKRDVWAGRDDICGLLLVWFVGAWFAVLVISLIAHPAMVARFALPAAAPALLLPMVIAHRMHRYAPPILMVVFILGAAERWAPQERPPGLREMAAYLDAHVDPQQHAVVLVFDSAWLGWEDMERLSFDYYPLNDLPVFELPLGRDGKPVDDTALRDPRALYLVVLGADPFQIASAAGRAISPIVEEGFEYSQLPFLPYRLALTAPLAGEPE